MATFMDCFPVGMRAGKWYLQHRNFSAHRKSWSAAFEALRRRQFAAIDAFYKATNCRTGNCELGIFCVSRRQPLQACHVCSVMTCRSPTDYITYGLGENCLWLANLLPEWFTEQPDWDFLSMKNWKCARNSYCKHIKCSKQRRINKLQV